MGGGKFLWGLAWTGSHMAVNGGSVIMEWRMCGKGQEKKVCIQIKLKTGICQCNGMCLSDIKIHLCVQREGKYRQIIGN